MKTENHLEEIMSLRPKGGASAEILAAVAAIEGKARDWGKRAEVLREKREAGLLSMTADELMALDRDVAALGIAGEQARELVSQLKAKAAERRREERIEALLAGPDGRAALVDRQRDFAARFAAFYEIFAAQYVALAAEREELVAAAERFNRQVEMSARETGVTAEEMARRVPRVGLHAVSVAYFDRVCLPVPGLDAAAVFWVEMLHAGKFWQPGAEGGLNPKVAKMLAQTAAAAARAEEERRRREDAQRERERELYGEIPLHKGALY